MFTRLKRSLGELRRDSPGRRFQNRYDRVRLAGGMGIGSRVLLYLGAILCILIGVVLVFLPGPAVLFFFLAGGLLASEARPIGKALDWCEVKLRELVARLRRLFRR